MESKYEIEEPPHKPPPCKGTQCMDMEKKNPFSNHTLRCWMQKKGRKLREEKVFIHIFICNGEGLSVCVCVFVGTVPRERRKYLSRALPFRAQKNAPVACKSHHTKPAAPPYHPYGEENGQPSCHRDGVLVSERDSNGHSLDHLEILRAKVCIKFITVSCPSRSLRHAEGCCFSPHCIGLRRTRLIHTQRKLTDHHRSYTYTQQRWHPCESYTHTHTGTQSRTLSLFHPSNRFSSGKCLGPRERDLPFASGPGVLVWGPHTPDTGEHAWSTRISSVASYTVRECERDRGRR